MDRTGRREGNETRFRCPADGHRDEHPSARWNPAKAAWCCDACGASGGALDLADRLGVGMPNFKAKQEGSPSSVKAATTQPGLTRHDLAQNKQLPVDELLGYGLYDLANYNGQKAVGIPYFDADGELVATRFRIAFTGDRFRWKRGDKPKLYGLSRLAAMRNVGWCLCVEGETDCWTAWHFDIPAIGVPGKTIWKQEWAPFLDGLDVYVWQEPDADDFAKRIGSSIPSIQVIRAPDGIKDLSEAHIQGEDVPTLIESLKCDAVPFADMAEAGRRVDMENLQQRAMPILEAADPLCLVERSIRDLGYGGQLTPAVVTYLAATSRLLGVRNGTMLAHLLLNGPASAGKSYTVGLVLRLLPACAYTVIDAGSPRVLIYDEAEYQHRVLVFGEADSIPAGEDNPAASAIRNLLQENRLIYKVTIKDPATGGFRVQTVDKAGPTVMITTATRTLGHQLSTRLFTLDVPDDPAQMRAALIAQGALEEYGAPAPDPALIAFQEYLQALAPWSVSVPFAGRLAELVARTHASNRVLRDFQRLLSLTKAVAVIRHRHRQLDSRGRLIATIEDYATVHQLVNHVFEASVSGASNAVRETVAAVQQLIVDGKPVSALEVANSLGINKSTATRRIQRAINEGWLINEEQKKGRPYRLLIGDPLPPQTGLPDPDELAESSGCTVAAFTDESIPSHFSPMPQETLRPSPSGPLQAEELTAFAHAADLVPAGSANDLQVESARAWEDFG